MKKTEYKIYVPGGNKTALVIDKNYTKDERQEINRDILSKRTDIEQVGFIYKNERKLEMAGGEFCVNASRAAIKYYLKDKVNEIDLSVSGKKNNVIGGIDENGNVYLNLVFNILLEDVICLKKDITIIKIEGITFGFFNNKENYIYLNQLKINEENTKMEMKEVMKQKINDNEKANGIILYEYIEGKIKINPIIWVKETDTIYYESACGSGSIATAIYGISKDRKFNKIVQPSNNIYNIECLLNGKTINSIKLYGKVEIENE